MWIRDGRGEGGRRMWIRKFLNVNIINFENVDKPEGGGWTMGKRFFVIFWHNLMLFWPFEYIFSGI
jgi:hypothetical protein